MVFLVTIVVALGIIGGFYLARELKSTHADDDLSFTVSSTSPTVGYKDGGGTLTMTGANIPYNSTDAYVRDADGDGTNDLIALYDAIDNAGQGDTGHTAYGSGTADAPAWKDLSGNGNDLTLPNGGTFGSNYLHLDSSKMQYGKTAKQIDLTKYSHVTVEARFRLTSTDKSMMLYEFTPNWNNHVGGFGFDLNVTCAGYTDNWLHTNYSRSTKIADAPYRNDGTWVTTTDIQSDVADATGRQVWYDGARQQLWGVASPCNAGVIPTTKATEATVANSFADDYFWFNVRGENINNGSATSANFGDVDLTSVRIYGAKISAGTGSDGVDGHDDARIAANKLVDERRFISPPTVKIGDKDCSNVVVSSATSMSCSIPAGDPGTQSITVSYNNVTETVGQYTYWGVTSISPTSGDPAGGTTTLTLTGDGFPYGDASKYIGGNGDATAEGLVAWYDGINNTGDGDTAHSTTATT
jgi:hypothetical protein